VQVFAVWEPILLTDWSRPSTAVLKRLADARVAQFWDARHVLAKRMAQDARDPQPEQQCCERDGYLWDLAAVYPAGAVWKDALPAAVVFDGPVVRRKDQLVEALARLTESPQSGPSR
jgi:hypothetical protein